MPIMDTLKDPKTGKIKPVWIIAFVGIGGVALLLLLGRGGSKDGTPINGQSSDVTGSLGALEQLLQQLLGNQPKTNGTTTNTTNTTPTGNTTGSGLSAHQLHLLHLQHLATLANQKVTTTSTVSNVSSSVGTAPRTNNTSYISPTATRTGVGGNAISTGGLSAHQLHMLHLQHVATQNAAVLSGPKTGGYTAPATSVVLSGNKTGTPVAKKNTVVLAGTKTGGFVKKATAVVLAGPKTGSKPATTTAAKRPATIASGTTRSINAARDNPN